ncbi:MAG: patatin-like phospholipase family protein [Sphingobacteriales bacterium]|nr:patatin-like phospholipase family protein [Sphingobacteriales bacterium]
MNQTEARDEFKIKVDSPSDNQEGKEKIENISLKRIDFSTESKALKYPKEIQASSNYIDFKELSKDLIDNQTKGIVGFHIKENGAIGKDQNYIDELLNKIISGTTDFNQTNWKDLKTINDKIIDSNLNPLNNNHKLIDLLVTKFYSFTKKVVNAKKNKFTQQLVVVAADITNQIKVEFPGMHEFYWGDDYTISPAEYIRASMSIPFFFSPYKVTLPNTQLIKINEIWRNKMNAYKNFTPQNNEVLFVDGGMLSNFPINVFYDNISYCIPTRPTIGIKLEFDSDDFYKLVDNEFKLSLSMLSTMRFFYDRDFMQKHNDFKRTVRSVDTGSISWLNFNPTENEKLELFYRGALTATIFLAGENLTNEQKMNYWKKPKQILELRTLKPKIWYILTLCLIGKIINSKGQWPKSIKTLAPN